MFTSGSYFWPILIGLLLFGAVALVGVIAFGYVFTRRSEPTPPADEPLAKQRLHGLLGRGDLHAHDQTVVDEVAKHLEPAPVTKRGQEAQLREMLEQAKSPETGS